MNILDFESLPLTSTTDWDTYYSVEKIPIIFGPSVKSRPIQFSSDRRRWLASSGKLQNVSSVLREGSNYSEFQMVHQLDSAGHQVTVVDLNDPVEPDENLVFICDGLIGIDSPADIILYVLNILGKGQVNSSSLDRYRTECLNENIQIRGVINDRYESIRQIMDSIAISTGALWSRSSRDLFRLWPYPIDLSEPIYGTYEPRNSELITAVSRLENLIAAYNIEYDFNNASDQPSGSLRLIADQSDIDYPNRPIKTVRFDWIYQLDVAIRIGSRILQEAARPSWDLQFLGKETDRFKNSQIPSGVLVELTNPDFPLTGYQLIRENRYTESNRDSTFRIVSPSGDAPVIRLISSSSVGEDQAVEVFVTFDDGITTITVKDDNQLPLENAIVTINGISRTSNSLGQVSFIGLEPGSYTATITAVDFPERTQEITVTSPVEVSLPDNQRLTNA